jgi:peroxiredoxin
MAQLRQNYQFFQALGAEVIAVGPEEPGDFKKFWDAEKMPFPGLADPHHVAADRFCQEVRILKLGRMPALFVIDREGVVRLAHRATAMWDIPPDEQLFDLLRTFREKANES